MVVGKETATTLLSEAEVRGIVAEALGQADLGSKRVLVIIPDGTRSGPIDQFFRLFHELLWGRVAALDYLIALGTHQPMTAQAILQRLGVSTDELAGRYAGVRIFNHHWESPETCCAVGTVSASETENLSRGLLSKTVPITINRMVLAYDQVIVCGPVFPHEVIGFSGGNKYFFPGISGPEVIDFTHWLGALITSYEIIGTKHTPVRAFIDRAASMIQVSKLCFCLVVKDAGLAGLYAGAPQKAWSRAADLSAQVHITYAQRAYRQVLSVMPEMYDDLWTAAKGMYKVEPVVADGGEVVIYAPHITRISHTHGHIIEQIGYHVRDYFVKQWNRFKQYPWAVLAHSTHLRGIGTYHNGREQARIRVTLATGIPRQQCEHVNLGYRDPATVDPNAWVGREAEGILLVPHAGEVLYRLNDKPATQ